MGGGSVAALRGVSLLFLAGEYVAIMGSSGSGKSTLLNLLGCLDTPTSGHYLLEGTDVAGMTDRQLSALRRSRFGFVFQSFNLIAQISVLENIEVPLFYQGRGRRECRERALALAAMVGLEHRVRHRPSELSGGQMQRVAIARALANDPSVILADEPTGNLDSKTGAEIMTTLDGLVEQGRTIILVTHEDAVAAHARRVIHLADGLVDRDEPRPGPHP
ncbi:MAG: ABC transporter ATP-binding protein [Lentisphaeria bacterium]|nr:ABC transporter ATP-binding protein [Lentisphaeria bacterium]